MLCDDLDGVIEAMADGTYRPSVDEAAHAGSCPRCQARIARAEAIEHLLLGREDAVPSPGFTSGVMARIGDEHWKADRVFDIGFNVAIAAGLLLVLGAGVGLAWSLGLVTVAIDIDPATFGVGALTARALSQLQTVAMAAVLLTMALGLWWWVEMDEGF